MANPEVMGVSSLNKKIKARLIAFIIKIMANPEGAKAWEPYKNFDVGDQSPKSITSPCQRLARGLGSGLKPSLGQGRLDGCDPAGEPCFIAAPC